MDSRSLLQRIDHAQEWEAVEVGVAGADLADAVFPHQDRGAEVVQKVAS